MLLLQPLQYICTHNTYNLVCNITFLKKLEQRKISRRPFLTNRNKLKKYGIHVGESSNTEELEDGHNEANTCCQGAVMERGRGDMIFEMLICQD